MIRDSVEKKISNILRRNKDKDNTAELVDEINFLLSYIATLEQDNMQLSLAVVKLAESNRQQRELSRHLQNDVAFYYQSWLSLRSTVEIALKHGKNIRPLIDQELNHGLTKRVYALNINPIKTVK